MGLEAATYIEELVTTNPLTGDFKSEGDDHFRLIKAALKATFPGLGGAFGRVQTKASGYTVVAGDNTTQIRASSALTLSLTAAATLGNKHSFSVDASGGDVLLDPAGAELINGVASFTVPRGFIGLVWCDGAAFVCSLSTKTSGLTQAITGNITFTSVDVAGRKEVTAASDMTLPAASAALINTRILVHSSTTAKVRILPNGSNTIEGLNQAYRVPSWASVELECISATGWILLRAPQFFVGQLVPSAVAQTMPGFLPADFAAVSRTTYGGLFDLLGSTHGPGDGSTTFNVPDTRGRSLIGTGVGTFAEAVDAADVSTANDTFDVVSNNDTWLTGMKVQVTTSGTLPTGLSLATDYWIIRGSSTTIKFATSLANAQNGTDVNITTQGTGIHTVTHTLTSRVVGKRGGEEDHAMSSTELLAHSHGLNDPTHSHIEQSGQGAGGSSFEMAPGVGGKSGAGTSTANSTNTAATGISMDSVGGNAAMNNMNPFDVVPFYIKT